MVTEKELIVVIETGSATVSGAAGYKRADGGIEVVAYASEPSADFIRNGVVRNIDRTAQCLTNIINMLEGALENVSIDKVYVGIGGYTLHTIPTKVERGFEEETRVTAEMVESMIIEQEERIVSDKTVIDVIPQEYTVDSLTTGEPVGCNCRNIVGEYLNLMARFSTMENLRAAFEMAKLEDTDTLVTPLQLAEHILSPTERSLGCTLVDIGAGCTTVSIWKGGRLRFLSVIPLGDSLITADLETLGIGADEAERIKRTIGLTTTNDDAAIYRVESGNDILLKDIGLVIRARMQEILVNVANQVKQGGFTDDKPNASYIFTGGAMEIPGAEEYIKSQLPTITRVRVAGLDSSIRWTAAGQPCVSKQLVLASLIAAGEDNCITIVKEPVQEIDYTDPNIGQGSLFTDDGEDAQSIRDQKAEEARQRKAAEKQRKLEERQRKAEEKANKPKRESFFDRMKRMRDRLTDMINENE